MNKMSLSLHWICWLCFQAKLAIEKTMRNSSVPLMSSEPLLLPHAQWEKWSHKDLVKYFTFKKYRDSPSEARSALLVATATFHASLTPPGVPWQESHMPDVSMNRTSTNTPNQQQKRRPWLVLRPIMSSLTAFSSLGLRCYHTRFDEVARSTLEHHATEKSVDSDWYRMHKDELASMMQ